MKDTKKHDLIVGPTFSHIFKILGDQCKLCQDMAKYAYQMDENCLYMNQSE